MSELRNFPRLASTVASLSALMALILIAITASSPADAAGAAKCPSAKKAKGACPKTSKRTSYKTVRAGYMVKVPHTPAGDGESEVVAIGCPRAEHVLAGGVTIAEPAAPFLTVTLSSPNEKATGWLAQLTNLSTSADSEAWVSVYAVCEISPTPKAS